MQLDIYRRPENHGRHSYLAVPAERHIPEEVINTDWQLEVRALEVDEQVVELPQYAIDHVSEQIAEKAYAVSRLAG